MPVMFNALLRDADIEFRDVRLLRHKDQRADKGKTPFDLWMYERAKFDIYQSHQEIKNRERLKAPYWASFVGLRDGSTLFVGLYTVKHLGVNQVDVPRPHREGVDLAGTCDAYELTPHAGFTDIEGRLFIEWGDGTRMWIQRADNQSKVISELRTKLDEDPFPGFLNLQTKLSSLDGFPPNWVSILREAKGVYLLTCPKTREQYVGKADGAEGFWGRWQQYARTGHGENVALKSREPSDYEVSILEVAGSRATAEDIIGLEVQWKTKLRSREMGLNRN